MKRKRKDRHHIIPRSRGGTDFCHNIVVVNRKQHETYHKLFSNKTPEEIIKYLVETFWGCKWGYVYDALYRHEEEDCDVWP